jgi:hypothetical protein
VDRSRASSPARQGSRRSNGVCASSCAEWRARRGRGP